MAEEKKQAGEENNKEHTHEHEIPKSVEMKKLTPWEHFKQSRNFKKNAHGFGATHLNRRTGGKGG